MASEGLKLLQTAYPAPGMLQGQSAPKEVLVVIGGFYYKTGGRIRTLSDTFYNPLKTVLFNRAGVEITSE